MQIQRPYIYSKRMSLRDQLSSSLMTSIQRNTMRKSLGMEPLPYKEMEQLQLDDYQYQPVELQQQTMQKPQQKGLKMSQYLNKSFKQQNNIVQQEQQQSQIQEQLNQKEEMRQQQKISNNLMQLENQQYNINKKIQQLEQQQQILSKSQEMQQVQLTNSYKRSAKSTDYVTKNELKLLLNDAIGKQSSSQQSQQIDNNLLKTIEQTIQQAVKTQLQLEKSKQNQLQQSDLALSQQQQQQINETTRLQTSQLSTYTIKRPTTKQQKVIQKAENERNTKKQIELDQIKEINITQHQKEQSSRENQQKQIIQEAVEKAIKERQQQLDQLLKQKQQLEQQLEIKERALKESQKYIDDQKSLVSQNYSFNPEIEQLKTTLKNQNAQRQNIQSISQIPVYTQLNIQKNESDKEEGNVLLDSTRNIQKIEERIAKLDDQINLQLQNKQSGLQIINQMAKKDEQKQQEKQQQEKQQQEKQQSIQEIDQQIEQIDRLIEEQKTRQSKIYVDSNIIEDKKENEVKTDVENKTETVQHIQIEQQENKQQEKQADEDEDQLKDQLEQQAQLIKTLQSEVEQLKQQKQQIDFIEPQTEEQHTTTKQEEQQNIQQISQQEKEFIEQQQQQIKALQAEQYSLRQQVEQQQELLKQSQEHNQEKQDQVKQVKQISSLTDLLLPERQPKKRIIKKVIKRVPKQQTITAQLKGKQNNNQQIKQQCNVEYLSGQEIIKQQEQTQVLDNISDSSMQNEQDHQDEEVYNSNASVIQEVGNKENSFETSAPEITLTKKNIQKVEQQKIDVILQKESILNQNQQQLQSAAQLNTTSTMSSQNNDKKLDQLTNKLINSIESNNEQQQKVVEQKIKQNAINLPGLPKPSLNKLTKQNITLTEKINKEETDQLSYIPNQDQTTIQLQDNTINSLTEMIQKDDVTSFSCNQSEIDDDKTIELVESSDSANYTEKQKAQLITL